MSKALRTLLILNEKRRKGEEFYERGRSQATPSETAEVMFSEHVDSTI
jgi:hypothetical protein